MKEEIALKINSIHAKTTVTVAPLGASPAFVAVNVIAPTNCSSKPDGGRQLYENRNRTSKKVRSSSLACPSAICNYSIFEKREDEYASTYPPDSQPTKDYCLYVAWQLNARAVLQTVP